MLIINADDWGRDRNTTERTLDCIRLGSVSSVSAMVFMDDSERAAAVSREHGVDAGLHLNFTTPLSAQGIPARLVECQLQIMRYLRRHRFAQVVFHPGLSRSFEYVAKVQLDEFARLYGTEPHRVDGHHHMHLCANVVLGKLMPAGTLVRRNFTFQVGEKGVINRLYRQFVDHLLQRRHILLDCLFNLAPLEHRDHVKRIFSLAQRLAVEVEVHPVNPEEYKFLMDGELFRLASDRPVAPRVAVVRSCAASSNET